MNYEVTETIDQSAFGGHTKQFSDFKAALKFSLTAKPLTQGANGWAIFTRGSGSSQRMHFIDLPSGVSLDAAKKAFGRFHHEIVDDAIWVATTPAIIRETLAQLSSKGAGKSKAKMPVIKVERIGVQKRYGEAPLDRVIKISAFSKTFASSPMSQRDATYAVADAKRGLKLALDQQTDSEAIELVEVIGGSGTYSVYLRCGDSTNDSVILGEYRSRDLANEARSQLRNVILAARQSTSFTRFPF